MPRGEALWRRGRVVGVDAGRVATDPVPAEIAGCSRARRVGVQDPAGGAPAAAIAVRVPVEPVVHAVRSVVRCPGGGGAVHGVGKRRRVYIDAHCLPRVALVAAQAPHRLSRSVGQAEHAHVSAVHVVEEGHGADALANGGAR
eukprot:scaffold23068_cov70-Phaeocystis_antarctica.AAC.1